MGHFIWFDVNFLQTKGLNLKENQLLDTCRLATVLLPNEQSYSLEILSEKYELKHQNKHRALDDTLVSIELYELLKNKIKEIPANILNQIQNTLQKSSWAWKEEFFNINQNDIIQTETTTNKTTKTIETKTRNNPELTLEIQKILNDSKTENQKINIIEAELYHPSDYLKALTEYNKTTHKKIIISTPKQIEINTENKILSLKTSYDYFCSNRFHELLSKKIYTDTEAMFIIKILLWLPHLKSGERHEIKLQKEEYKIWTKSSYNPNLCHNCNPEKCFYLAAKKRAIDQEIKYIPHINLLKEIDNFKNTEILLIDQTELLEENITYSLTETFNQEKIDSLLNLYSANTPENLKNEIRTIYAKFEILFGLIGILLNKMANNANELGITPLIQNLPEYKNILQSTININSLIEKIPIENEHLHEIRNTFQNLIKSLHNNANLLITIFKTPENNLILKSTPIEIGEILNEKLFNQIKTTILISPALSFQKKIQYIPDELKIKNNVNTHLIKQNNVTFKYPAYLIKDLPPPKEPSSLNAMQEFISKYLNKKKSGQLMIATSSDTSSKILHQNLAPEFKPQKLQIFAPGVGGLGKIIQMYKQDPFNSILIGNYKFLTKILEESTEIEEKLRPKTLIICHLYFDPPSNRLIQERSLKFSNKFMEYVLPSTTIKLKSLIDSFIQTGGETVITLDSRITNDQYGKYITESLPSYLNITKIEAKDIL